MPSGTQIPSLSIAEKELRDLRRDIADKKELHLLGPERVDPETRKLLAEVDTWEANIDIAKKMKPVRRNIFTSCLQTMGILETPANSQEFFAERIRETKDTMRHTVEMRTPYIGICSVGFYKSFLNHHLVRSFSDCKMEGSTTTSDIVRVDFYKQTSITKDDAYRLCSDLSRICCVVQGHLSHQNSFSRADQELVMKIAELLEDSIVLITRLLQIPLCLSVLTNRAVYTVDSFHLYIRERSSKQERDSSGLFENVSQWKCAFEHFRMVEMTVNTFNSGTSNPAKQAWKNSQILEEYKIWGALDSKESASIQDQINSGRISVQEALNIALRLFTFRIISKKFTINLKLPVLVANPPAKSYCILQGTSGSFATVYRVKLPYCLKIDQEVMMNNGEIKKVSWVLEEVAVKVAKQDRGIQENATCIRVARELRIWSKMKHENIVPLLGLWSEFKSQVGKVGYYVPIAPWMDEDLARFAARKEIGKHQRLSLLRDVCSALKYMHNRTSAAVIHGDLRANNILVKTGRAYLCDFGISKFDDDVSGFSSIAHGNVRWIPPERLNDDMAGPTIYGDMYSFGSVMLEAMTGNHPWPEDTDFAVSGKRFLNKYETSPRPKDCVIDDPIWTLIEKCWSNGPEFRPTSQVVYNEMNALMEMFPSMCCCDYV